MTVTKKPDGTYTITASPTDDALVTGAAITYELVTTLVDYGDGTEHGVR